MAANLSKVEDEDAFWQRLILPEEDRITPYVGGYRWFRSPNVVDLAKVRRLKGRQDERS